jgi:hypothetical protein
MEGVRAWATPGRVEDAHVKRQGLIFRRDPFPVHPSLDSAPAAPHVSTAGRSSTARLLPPDADPSTTPPLPLRPASAVAPLSPASRGSTGGPSFTCILAVPWQLASPVNKGLVLWRSGRGWGVEGNQHAQDRRLTYAAGTCP